MMVKGSSAVQELARTRMESHSKRSSYVLLSYPHGEEGTKSQTGVWKIDNCVPQKCFGEHEVHDPSYRTEALEKTHHANS